MEFRQAIALAHQALVAVDEEHGRRPFRNGGWLRVELLGHLIDSCLYNHVRFLTATNSRALEVTRYDQLGSVTLHAYAELGWEGGLDHWCIHNELRARRLERFPNDAFSVESRWWVAGTMPLVG